MSEHAHKSSPLEVLEAEVSLNYKRLLESRNPLVPTLEKMFTQRMNAALEEWDGMRQMMGAAVLLPPTAVV